MEETMCADELGRHYIECPNCKGVGCSKCNDGFIVEDEDESKTLQS